MTMTLLMVLGILIAAVGTTAGFVYYDMDSGSALEGGMIASQGITSLVQSAASFQDANGVRAASVDDLKSIDDMPKLPGFPGAYWAVGGGFVCLYGDHDTIADRSLKDAASRLGPHATVSGACGDAGTAPDKNVVLSYPIAS